MKNITLISSSKKICTIEPIRSLLERDSITPYDDALLEGKVDINSLSLTIIQKNNFREFKRQHTLLVDTVKNEIFIDEINMISLKKKKRQQNHHLVNMWVTIKHSYYPMDKRTTRNY